MRFLIFLQIGYLLGHQYDKHDLDDLRRLNADAEKAQPARVAGIAETPNGMSSRRRNVSKPIRSFQRLAMMLTSRTVRT